MTQKLSKIDKSAISAILDSNRSQLSNIKSPFAGEILIFHDVNVAGTRNVFLIDEITSELEIGSRIKLLRDKKNLQSKWAVKVLDSKEREFGFLSADCAETVSRLMDAGKACFAKVSNIELRGDWHLIELEVYLDD